MWEDVTWRRRCYWCRRGHIHMYTHLLLWIFTPLHSAHVLSLTVDVSEKTAVGDGDIKQHNEKRGRRGGGRSAGEQREGEGREGDAVAEWVEAVINTNLNDVRRGQRAKQPRILQDWWEERVMGEDTGSQRRRWESWPVKKHHQRSTVHVLIHNKKRKKEGKRRFLCSVLLLCCCLPTEEGVRALQLSDASHAGWTHSVCGESALPGSTLRYFQQLPVVELRFRGCFMWSGGSSGSRWSTYQVLCVWRPAAREYLRTFERRRVFKHVLKSENNIKKGKRRSRRFKGKCWVFWRNHQFGMLKTKIPRSQESWCGALGDESWEGAREGWGGKNGLPLPCGTSNRLHRCLPMSMQVLQIVKELVSPSRRRAVARFGGVCR